MKKICSAILFSLFTFSFLKAQIVFQSDNFDDPTKWSLNIAVGAPVNSTEPTKNFVNETPTEDNRWIINNAYTNGSYNCINLQYAAGTVKPQPDYITNKNTNYLHIISKCAMDAGQLAPSWNSQLATTRRIFAAMNYDFSTVGYYSVNFSCWSYHAQGVSIYFSTNSGATWEYLGELTAQGDWIKANFTNSALDNKPTVRFGFLWDDSKGKDRTMPGVDAIELSVPELNVSFFNDKSTVCEALKEVVKFTNNTYPEDAGISYNWTITPGTINVDYKFVNSTSASSKNPEIQFLKQGTYKVKLTVNRLKPNESKTYERTISVIAGCQCQSGGGIEVLLDEKPTLSNWLLTNSNGGNWQSTPSSALGSPNFNGSTSEPAAYLPMVSGFTAYPNNSTADMTWKTDIDFSNTSATYTLEFEICNEKYSTFQNSLLVYISNNSGTTWDLVTTFNDNTGPYWVKKTVDLTSYKGSANVRIRFTGKRSSSQFAGAYDLGLRKIKIIKETTGGSTGNNPTATIKLQGDNPGCEGNELSFTCTVSNLGTATVDKYIWYVNGVKVQESQSNTYTSSTLKDGDLVTCAIMLKGGTCEGPFESLPISIKRLPKIEPMVSIKSEPGGLICRGTAMTFNAIPQNAGNNPTFEWKLNGQSVSNLPIYTSSTLENGDKLEVFMTVEESVCVTAKTVSASYEHYVMDTTVVTLKYSQLPCEGNAIDFSFQYENGEEPFMIRWYVNDEEVWKKPSYSVDETRLKAGDVVKVVVASNNTCKGTSSVIIQNKSIKPDKAIVDKESFCSGDVENITLSYEGGFLSPGAEAIWYDNQELTNEVGKGSPLTIKAPEKTTTYYLVFKGACNETEPVSVTVNVSGGSASLVLKATQDSVCYGKSVILNAIVSEPEKNYTYQWSDTTYTGKDLLIKPKESKTYSVTVTNEIGCSASASIYIKVLPKPNVSFTADETKGCNPLDVKFDVTSTDDNIKSYLWDFGDKTTSTIKSPTHTYDKEGKYTVKLVLTNNSGCVDSLVKKDYIEVYPTPVADFTTDPEEIKTYSPTATFNSSTDATQWLWDMGDGSEKKTTPPGFSHTFSNVSDRDTVFKVYLHVTNEFGCKDSITKEVKIINDKITFTNVITPNGDGINDFLEIPNVKNIPNNKLVVYNRWGQKVFEANNYKNDWDGGNLPDGVYYYVFTYGDKKYTFSLTIIRK